MPLTRDTITASSRVMLVIYPLFSLAVGLSYILGNPSRTASPSFDVVRGIMPLSLWGWFFLALSVLKCAAWATRRRDAMVLALCIAFGVYCCWTFGFAVSLVVDANKPGPPLASFGAIWLWGFVAAAHVATLRSLTRD